MTQACVHPTKEEIIEAVKKIPHWNMFTSKCLMAMVMRHYKGKLNPAFVRPIIEEFIEDVR